MKTLLQIFVVTLLVFLCHNIAVSQTTEEKVVVEQNTEEKKSFPLDVTGSVDTYYQYGFQGVTAPTAFATRNNVFALGMFNLTCTKTVGKVGVTADLGFGPRMDDFNYNYKGTTISTIKQLFVTYAPTDKLTLTFGSFATHIGYELTEPQKNMNYSMAYMFSYGPYFHTGIKANYAFTKELSGMIGLFNDTDRKFDAGKGKHVGAQLAYVKDKISVYLNYNGGKADTITDHQADLVANYNATDKITIGTNITTKTYAIGNSKNTTEKAANFQGAAVYAKFGVADNTSLAIRGEIFQDPKGYLLGINDQTITALTLTGNIKIDNLLIQPELRIDTSSKSGFKDGDGKATASLPTVLLAATYSF
jgi:Putative beta-barrel porin-2, OmpL-like. bbp2